MIERERGTADVRHTDLDETMEMVKNNIEEHGFSMLKVGCERVICPLGTTIIYKYGVAIVVDGYERIITSEQIDDVSTPSIVID
jgi:hypothetical protein